MPVWTKRSVILRRVSSVSSIDPEVFVEVYRVLRITSYRIDADHDSTSRWKGTSLLLF